MEPKALQTGINAALNAEILRDQQDVVRNGFFYNLFQALAEHRNMTATEVVERKEEKITFLAPAITSLQKEIFSPLIERVLHLLRTTTKKDRRIPEPPVSFDFDIVYSGLLALAMSNVQANAMEATLAKWAPYDERLRVFDNVDPQKAFRKSWISGGAPAEVLREIEDIEADREIEKQLQVAAAQTEIAESASKAYRNVNEVPEEGSLAATI